MRIGAEQHQLPARAVRKGEAAQVGCGSRHVLAAGGSTLAECNAMPRQGNADRHEGGGERTCPFAVADTCHCTSHVKGYPFEVPLPAGLPVGGVILADQVKSLDWRSRHAALIARLPDEVLEDILLKLAALLQVP